MKYKAWVLPLLTFGACALVAGLWLQRLAPLEKPLSADRYNDRRDFSLTNSSGQRVTLATFQGKFILMFFGFTNCPDACPMAMVNVGSTLREMGSAADRIQPVFVTVDPDRDTPETLNSYLKNFGDNLIGLWGSDDEITAITKRYGVYFKRRALADGDYTIDHSTALYLISPTGAYLRPFTPDMDPIEFARLLIKTMASTPEK